MDVPKAMSILGFSGARHFDSTSLPEIEKKFTLRIHALEQYKGPSGSKYDMRRSYSPSPLKVGMGGPLYSFNPGRGYEEVVKAVERAGSTGRSHTREPWSPVSVSGVHHALSGESSEFSL